MSGEPKPLATQHAADFHLLGQVNFDRYLALQRRLVYAAATSDRPRITVLLCEHNSLITVGRSGSRGHLRMTADELRRERLEVRWMNRGGGCILHGPGQLAVYPVAPLLSLGWTVGEFLRRFQQGLRSVLDELQITTKTQPDHFGIWGRSGLLVAFGVGVQQWVTCHGAAVNVNPAMSRYGRIETAASARLPAGEKGTMSCLLAERRLPVKMTHVRAAAVASLAAAFSCTQHHVHSGHPWLRLQSGATRDGIARAS